MDRLIGAPRRKITSLLLLVFGLWDIVLAAAALVTPGLWFRLFHGVGYNDPEALLARTGAVWLAFGVFQLYAWRKWEQQPYWLAVVGGMRLSEIFADWTYLFGAHDITSLGASALLTATPSNVFFAWFFIDTSVRITRAQLAGAQQLTAAQQPARAVGAT
jgi:hypothetical protein